LQLFTPIADDGQDRIRRLAPRSWSRTGRAKRPAPTRHAEGDPFVTAANMSECEPYQNDYSMAREHLETPTRADRMGADQ
jgi:hypothetical protein